MRTFFVIQRSEESSTNDEGPLSPHGVHGTQDLLNKERGPSVRSRTHSPLDDE